MIEHSYRFTPRKHAGKTVFLWYLLRYRSSLRLPTVSAIGGTYYFFHETGVYVASTTAPGYFLSGDVNTASGSKLVWAMDRQNERKYGATRMACSRLPHPQMCTSIG